MRIKEFLHELRHHVPFTIFATLIATLTVLLLVYYFKKFISEDLFRSIHILHIFASSLVTAGIYYKYNPKKIYALLIGIIGALLIGSLSDIFMPWVGGNVLGLNTGFHLPLIEIPIIILIAALIGSLIGIKTRVTRIPHFIHVFLSVFASLFYLLVFSSAFQLSYFILSFFIVFVAVIIPCCVNDILLPFFFLKKRIKKCNCK